MATANFGALTTAFTPPSDCSVLAFTNAKVKFFGGGMTWGEECRNPTYTGGPSAELITSCFPDGFEDDDGIELGYYSPGYYCPKSWTAACSVARAEGKDGEETPGLLKLKSKDGLRDLWNALEPGETAHQCCPEGFTCWYFSAGTCVADMTHGQTLTGYTSFGTTCPQDQKTFTLDDTFPYPAWEEAWAQAVVLIQSEGREPTETPDDDDKGFRGEGGGGGGDNEAGGGAGFSRAARIAVGTVIPIVVIAIVIGIYFIVRKIKKRKSMGAAQPGVGAAASTSCQDDQYGKPELEGSQQRSQSQTHSGSVCEDHILQTAELDQPGPNMHNVPTGQLLFAYDPRTGQMTQMTQIHNDHPLVATPELGPQAIGPRIHELQGSEDQRAELPSSSVGKN